MKKTISIVLASVLVFALAIPAMAAGSGNTKAELLAKVSASGAPSAYQDMANTYVNALTEDEAAAIDAAAVKAIASDVQAKFVACTLTVADINNAVASANAALPASAQVTVGDISVNPGTGAVSVAITAKGLGSTTVPGTMPITSTSGGGSTGSGSGVIKTTGMNAMQAVIALALAVVSVLGVAAVKARKVRICA